MERYFDRELAVSDYLMKEPGVWAGRGAERLGLRGQVERTQFVSLLRNEDPTNGKRLTARMNTSRQEKGEMVSNRQVGYGLVFRWDSITPEVAKRGPQLELPIDPRELAVEAYFAKHSVARDRILIAEILKRACGKLSREEVEQHVKSNRFIQLGSSHITSNQAKFEEESLLDLVRSGWDTCKPIGRALPIDPEALTDEQRKALEHTLASRDLAGASSRLAKVETDPEGPKKCAIIGPRAKRE